MIYTIERTEEDIIIRLPIESTPKQVQNALNYMKYVELGMNSQITDEDVQEMVQESKDKWWDENQERFKDVEGFEKFFKWKYTF